MPRSTWQRVIRFYVDSCRRFIAGNTCQAIIIYVRSHGSVLWPPPCHSGLNIRRDDNIISNKHRFKLHPLLPLCFFCELNVGVCFTKNKQLPGLACRVVVHHPPSTYRGWLAGCCCCPPRSIQYLSYFNGSYASRHD